MKKTKPLDEVILVCACNSSEHQIRFLFDREDNELSCEPHLTTNRNFFGRLFYGLRYTFGYKSKYGAWDSVIIKPEDREKLRDYLGNDDKDIVSEPTAPKAEPTPKKDIVLASIKPIRDIDENEEVEINTFFGINSLKDRDYDTAQSFINDVVLHFGVEESELHDSASIGCDLGFDSLDAIELIMLAEKHFEISLPDEEIEEIREIKTLCDVIISKM